VTEHEIRGEASRVWKGAFSCGIGISLAVLALTSCSRPAQEATKQDEPAQKGKYAAVPSEALDPAKMIPVGACKVVVTVVSIDSSRASTQTGDPCAKAPCTAVVRIDSVLGCGSSADRSLVPGLTLRARFTYTLASSMDLFPSLTPALPGLSVGSRFAARVQTSSEPAGLIVGEYELRASH